MLIVTFDADVTDWAVVDVVGAWSKLSVDEFALLTKLKCEVVLLNKLKIVKLMHPWIFWSYSWISKRKYKSGDVIRDQKTVENSKEP